VWRFTTVPDVPVSVNAGDDWVTWSGQEVQLAATVEDDAVSAMIFAWSADPGDGVVFSDPNAEDPIVTITKVTGNPSIVALTLTAYDDVSSDEDTMKIDVYDTACLAALGEGDAEIATGDFDADCDTDLKDFATLVAEWLVNNELTEPIPKP
jgi:hypothetical protein